MAGGLSRLVRNPSECSEALLSDAMSRGDFDLYIGQEAPSVISATPMPPSAYLQETFAVLLTSEAVVALVPPQK